MMLSKQLGSVFVSLFMVAGGEATTLFGGSHDLILPSTTTTECLDAFNTTISCDAVYIQYTAYTNDWVNWNTSMLQALCTSACETSLSDLYSSVELACGDVDFQFNGGNNLTYPQVVEMFQYKYGLICLTDEDSGDFCSDVESGWNISAMDAAGEATWPANTTKVYPDIWGAGWDPATDVDGSLLYDVNELNATGPVANNLSVQWTGQDYYNERPEIFDDTNYGWPASLEYDEYPIEIQCSSCFLQNIQHGIESTFGEIYDEVTSQVWANIQANCNITTALNPANNYTGVGYPGVNQTILPEDIYIDLYACPANVTVPIASGNGTISCDDFGLANFVASQTLLGLNPAINCHNLANVFYESVYCVPGQECSVAVVPEAQNYRVFVDSLAGNVTYNQFLTWNPYITALFLSEGEVVCVAPPGGTYTPTVVAVASPSVYTTTATPAAPTVSGTVANCGLYYEVQSGDYCNTIAIQFGITLDTLLAMNPELDSSCDNLWAGYDYCVGLVNGTTVAPYTSTASLGAANSTSSATIVPTSSSSSASTTASSVTSATSTYATAPAPTVSGTTADCYEYYTVVSGDSCYAIEQMYGITLAQFLSWNSYIDEDCDNLWVGYAYCVSA